MADITYIRLRQQFVYLAVVLDGFSRKVVGWALDRTLTARLPLLALQRAIALRQPAPGLVHHSDRGVQYASEQYTRLLHSHGILPSMSRPANPYDNAFCESFIKTLKREEIDAHKYQHIEELDAHLQEFIDQYYNRFRLHSALGYRTPEEFEAACLTRTVSPAPSVSFPRHGEIYRFRSRRRGRPRKAQGEPVSPDSPAHRIDESPVGYSLTGWSPPEPVSASPTENHSGGKEQHFSPNRKLSKCKLSQPKGAYMDPPRMQELSSVDNEKRRVHISDLFLSRWVIRFGHNGICASSPYHPSGLIGPNPCQVLKKLVSPVAPSLTARASRWESGLQLQPTESR